MKEISKDNNPAGVPSQGAAQAGDAKARERPKAARWAFAEPSVWTDRMLEALEKGVKGGVWFSLIDKVTRPKTLANAWERVRANKGAGGVDGQSIEDFKRQAAKYLAGLSEVLVKGTYVPQPVRRTYIPKADGKKRPLGIPTIRDRVVQTALRSVIEPIFEAGFSERSYGFRPRRGCKDALREVDAKLKAGYHFIVDADLKSYFDTIPHDRLMKLVRERIADGSVLALIEAYLKQGVFEDMREWKPEKGTPQGAVISPLLANVYLHPLDKLMEAKGTVMIRYADDFVLMCQSREDAEAALANAQAWTEAAGLTLHPEKTHIVDATQPGGFDFLGYHFECGHKTPRKKSLKKLKDTIREKTPRTCGVSLECVVASVNTTLRGWFEYFKDSRKWTFEPIDKWIRMRLRAVLVKRLRSNRKPYGRAHQMWPNAFFKRKGLFNLTRAHAQLSSHA